MLICKICKSKFKNTHSLGIHITKTHDINSKEYYDLYLKKKNEDICKECGNTTKFINFAKGYHTYCSVKCASSSKDSIDKSKQTKLERYGDENYNNMKKNEKTCLEKYGVKNPSQVKEVKNKKRKTLQKNHGVNTPLESKKIINKMKKTKLKKYGDENYNNPNKLKQTKLKKYGDENYTNRKKAKETCNEKYGTNTYSQTKKFVKKIKKTYLKKYGDENYVNIDKKNKTMMQKYGTKFYSQTKEYLEKVYKTKKKNNTFNTSKPEEKLYNILLSMFLNVKRNYKSKQYPFLCDFYIPKLKLYIEYQGSWTHGKEPYNLKNKEHQKILKEWMNKNTEYYNNAIEVWTNKDTLKREIAKKNNLNYLEIWEFKNKLDVLNQIKRAL